MLEFGQFLFLFLLSKCHYHQERKSLASELKLKGNNAYIERKFEEAVLLYTRAIEVTPEPDPVFYSNRAASMSPQTPKPLLLN